MSFTNRKRKYVEEKMTAKLKHKQTSIATVWYHLLPVASLLTPLIFHYPLPLIVPPSFIIINNSFPVSIPIKEESGENHYKYGDQKENS
jgi:hypothetical protein